MQIGKKAALMAAAAGAMVIGSAAGASAHSGLLGGNGVAQSNSCDVTTGAITSTGVAAPTGEIDLSPDCLNFTNSRAAVQSNDCDTTTGPIISLGTAAPTGEIEAGAECTNIAIAEPPTIVVKQVEKKEKHHKAVKKEKKAKKHAKKKAHGHH